jgi:hypothetical protein
MTPTPTAIPITPIAECIDVQRDGSIVAKFGYQNNSADTVNIPIGDRNKFTPGREDVGQPIEFFKGRVANIISVTIPAGSTLRWVLGNAFVNADITTPRCKGDPVCESTNNTDILSRLDNEASTLRTIARRIAKKVLSSNTSARNKRRAQAYMDKAQNLYLEQWSNVWGRFPQVSQVCPTCSQVDKIGDIQMLITSSEEQLALVNRAAELLKSAKPSGRADSPDTLIAWAKRIQARFATRAQTLPRFESKCE